MNNHSHFALPQPELEAEIYYLSEAEGGRETAVATGYRGQFFYDNNNWIAGQQFLHQQWCEPGQSVKVLLQTGSPHLHAGRFFVGKEFEIREGQKTVGRGTITKVLRNDFNYWDNEKFTDHLDNNIRPHADLQALADRFRQVLQAGQPSLLASQLEVEMTGNLNCMLMVRATALIRHPWRLAAHLIDSWKNHIALRHQLHKIACASHVTAQGELEIDLFTLHFATWDKTFFTGQIEVR